MCLGKKLHCDHLPIPKCSLGEKPCVSSQCIGGNIESKIPSLQKWKLLRVTYGNGNKDQGMFKES